MSTVVDTSVLEVNNFTRSVHVNNVHLDGHQLGSTIEALLGLTIVALLVIQFNFVIWSRYSHKVGKNYSHLYN